MGLSHITKVYAIQDLEISQLLADFAPGSAPSAPSTPAAPTVTGGAGGSSWAYKIVLSNGTDSAQSTAGTDTTGAATRAGLSGTANQLTVTLAAAVPAGQIAKVIITTAPDSVTGQIGTLKAGETAFVDDGSVTPIPYVANAPGGVGTLYNRKIKIPGAKTMEITGTVKTGMLRGDFSLLDAFSVLTDLKVSFNFAKANLDAYAAMVGGTVSDTGSTPNRISDWKLKRTTANDTTNRFHYFRLEGQSVGADPVAGDAHFTLPKCILDAFPKLGMAEEDYETFTASAIAIPLLADDTWLDVAINETSTQIGVAQ